MKLIYFGNELTASSKMAYAPSMTDVSDLYAQLREQAPVSGTVAVELATAFATEAVKDLRATSNRYTKTDSYMDEGFPYDDEGKPQFYSIDPPDPGDPAVRNLAAIFLQILSRRDLLRI